MFAPEFSVRLLHRMQKRPLEGISEKSATAGRYFYFHTCICPIKFVI